MSKSKSKKSFKKPVKSFSLSREKGLPLHFQIYLPPNIKDTAPLDSIAIKVEVIVDKEDPKAPEVIDKSKPYYLPQPHFKVARLLEDWCQGSPIPSLLQLSRQRLKSLLKPLVNEPVIYRPDQQENPLNWNNDGTLTGVHEHLGIEENGNTPPSIPSNKSAAIDAVTEISIDGSTQFLAIEMPSKNNPLYMEAEKLMKHNSFKLEPANNKWWLRDRHKVLNFLACHLDELKKNYKAKLSRTFRKKISTLQFAKIHCEAAQAGDAFSITLKIDIHGADENNLRSNLNRNQFYLQSPKGIVLVPPHKIEKLTETQRALSGQVDRTFSPSYFQRLSLPQLIDADTLLEDFIDEFQAPKSWKSMTQSLKNISKLRPAPASKELNKKLRPYQKIGAAWLWHLYKHGLGGVLADEMGLGKTAQAIAYLQSVLKNAPPESHPTCLVVCPASLVENWRREINIFAPKLKSFAHHGFNRLRKAEEFEKYEIVITSYTTLTRDSALFQEVELSAIIADEAQHIKNKQTQNAQTLRSMRSRGRVLLTGTPLENSLNDLRSLFDFLMPGYLVNPPSNSNRDDRSWYDDRIRVQASPYILRRSKILVAPELPEKIEQILYCEMDEAQNRVYKELREKPLKTIFEMEMAGANESQIRFAALSQLLRLRQVCADPRIIDENCVAENSAKLKAFREILQEAMDGNHRILVFSQFVSMLQLLKKELESSDIPYCYLDGKTKNRLQICDKFNNTASIPVFLISLKAGGTGLNLTGADIVVHFDPWWNPAVEAQATDRAHRIGQKKVVTSIKLIVSNSIEEKVIELQRTKASLIKDLFETSEHVNATIGLDEIKALIS